MRDAYAQQMRQISQKGAVPVPSGNLMRSYQLLRQGPPPAATNSDRTVTVVQRTSSGSTNRTVSVQSGNRSTNRTLSVQRTNSGSAQRRTANNGSRSANTNAPGTLRFKWAALIAQAKARAGATYVAVLAGWVLEEMRYGNVTTTPDIVNAFKKYKAGAVPEDEKTTLAQLKRQRDKALKEVEARATRSQTPCILPPLDSVPAAKTDKDFLLKNVKELAKKLAGAIKPMVYAVVLKRIKESGWTPPAEAASALQSCKASDTQIELWLKAARQKRESNAEVTAQAVTKTIFNRLKQQNAWASGGAERVPPAQSPQFPGWLADVFRTRMHYLLQNVKTTRNTVYNNLANPVAGDPCARELTPATAAIHAHQAVVSAMAKLRAADRIDTSGLLVMHSTGSGKTLIGLAILLAFWGKKTATGKPYPVVFVSTNDNQTNNDVQNLGKLAVTFYPNWTDPTTGTRPFAGVPAAEAAKVIRERIKAGNRALFVSDHLGQREKDRELYTFGKLGNDIKDGLVPATIGDAVFVMDEIQYILAPPATEPHLVQQYGLVRDMLRFTRDPKSTWVVGLTATPGETKGEIVTIMNAIMGPLNPPNKRMAPEDSLAVLASKARGYVSYAYLLGDASRYAPVTMRMKCSYLQGTYYHDVFLRSLKKRFGANPNFENRGRMFVDKYAPVHTNEVTGHTNLRVSAPPAPESKDDLYWAKWRYRPDRSQSFLEQLRRASLFMLLSKEELQYLRSMYDETFEGYRGNAEVNNANEPGTSRGRAKQTRATTWPIKELIIMTSRTDARNEDNQNAVADNRANAANALYQSRTANAAEPRRPRRQAAGAKDRTYYWRFLMSPKIPQFLDAIYRDLQELGRGGGGIHMVYTYNRTAALLLAHCLRKVLGMPQLKSASQLGTDGETPPYFAMITTANSNRPSLAQYTTKEGEIKGIQRVISSADNATGNIVKVVIASHKSFKGVDLSNIRYLHLLEPFVNFRDLLQYIGRGPRYCSHKALPAGRRKVDVILYRLAYAKDQDCATAGAALTNCFLQSQSIVRYTNSDGFKNIEDQVLWKASVDYDLFKDNLHQNRDAIFRMITGLKCEASSTTSSFRNMEKSVSNARFKATKQRIAERFPNAVEYEKRMKQKGAEFAAWHAYTEGLRALKKSTGLNQTQRRERVQTLMAQFPEAARMQAYRNAVAASRKASKNNAKNLDVWMHNIRAATAANNSNQEA